ncbi:MAG TPA: M48 family metalloprotease [Solimonas sp.]|nr:M48 family metalloprotease [Solimonas sp.]
MRKLASTLLTAGLVLAAAASRAESPAALDLPQIGEPADNSLSPHEEMALGSEVMGELFRSNYLLEDPELGDYAQTLGWKISANSLIKPPQISIFVVNDERINAFALPGGFIGINAGLILAASNESEIAGVLGHELAHVTQRHIARSQEDTGVATMATWLAVIAAIIAGSANPDVVIGALSLGQAINYQRQVNYTRAHELEADRIGIQTMARAGYDPNSMASFFVKLEQQSRLYGAGLPEILRTHPLNTNRIAEARSRAGEMSRVKAPDNTEFQLMQARTRVLSADRPGEPLDYYSGQLAAGNNTPGNRYGLAMAQAALGDSVSAGATLKPLLDQFPRQETLNLLKGRLQLLAGENPAALATFSRTLQLYPRSAPAILAYADALMADHKPEDARQVLLSHEQALGTNLQTYNLLAQAAMEVGNTAEAAYQTATFMFLRGDAGGALASLDAGLRLSSLTPQDRARLKAKRDEVRETLPANWRVPDGRERRALGQ